MQPWTQFYATVATAAAALLGLLFVVVSINVSVALGSEEAVSRRLTEQAFQNYLAVMLVAFVALFPGISTTTFGMVLLVAMAGGSAWVVVSLLSTRALQMRRRSWAYSLRRHISSLIGFGILLRFGASNGSELGRGLQLARSLHPCPAVFGDRGVVGVVATDG